MYLSRFRVKNYKCLADVDIPLTPIHVLIGPNDAGKTSLLETISAFYNSATEDLASVFPQPWDGRELVLHGSAEPHVFLRGEWGDSGSVGESGVTAPLSYEFLVVFPTSGNRCTSKNELITDAPIRDLVTTVIGPVDASGTLLRQGKRQGRPGVRTRLGAALDQVLRVLRSAQIYAFDPRVMRVPAAIDPQRKFRLDRDGFGLSTTLLDIQGHEPDLFLNLRTEFCRLFGHFKNIRVRTENAIDRKRVHALEKLVPPGVAYGYAPGVGAAIYFETRAGNELRAHQVSDGVMLILGFLALAHLPEPPSVVLIEEPENGIYPKTLEDVIRLLKELAYRTNERPFPQIILTTHSPYVLSFFAPEEVTFLSRDPQKPEAGVRARPLRDAPNIRERLAGGEFYLGELWYNLTEEELFGEPAEQRGPGGLRRGED